MLKLTQIFLIIEVKFFSTLLILINTRSLKDTKDGKGDDKRMAKVCDQRTLDYFEFLCEAEGKTIIDSELLARCKERADIVKNDSNIRALLGLDIISDQTKTMVYNELHVIMPYA